MKKYRCQICGFIYDEAVEGVKFEDLPNDWKCPLCGASKEMFEEVVEEDTTLKKEEVNETENNIFQEEDLRELSNYEISYICSNLAKGCEKQYLEEDKKLFQELANYYLEKEATVEGTLEDVTVCLQDDTKLIKEALNTLNKEEERGTNRVLTWAGKTTMMLEGILASYKNEGLEYLKNKKIWVCDICGFVYIGDTPPKVCPVCKVPSIKILEVK